MKKYRTTKFEYFKAFRIICSQKPGGSDQVEGDSNNGNTAETRANEGSQRRSAGGRSRRQNNSETGSDFDTSEEESDSEFQGPPQRDNSGPDRVNGTKAQVAAPSNSGSGSTVAGQATAISNGQTIDENRRKASAAEAIVLSDDDGPAVKVEASRSVKKESPDSSSAPQRTARKAPVSSTTPLRTEQAVNTSTPHAGVNSSKAQSGRGPNRSGSREFELLAGPCIKNEPVSTPSEEPSALHSQAHTAKRSNTEPASEVNGSLDDKEAVQTARRQVLQEPCLTPKGKAFMGRFLRDAERAKEYLDFRANGIQVELIKEELMEAQGGSLEGLWLENSEGSWRLDMSLWDRRNRYGEMLVQDLVDLVENDEDVRK